MSRAGSWHEQLFLRVREALDIQQVERENAGHPVVLDADGNLDAFGRLRTSDPETLFDSQLQYDTQPLLGDEKLVGTATVTHLPDESAANLTIGTAAGDRIVRQTRAYFRYQPGKSQQIFCTGVLGGAQAGCTKLIGYGDDSNGVFFGTDGGGPFVLLRSKKTGTADDIRKFYQADWNIDALDGEGKSGLTFDPTKTQIFSMDIEWLGVGRVRMALVVEGRFVFVHEFLNANRETQVYMTTANLPVRYEIRNTAATAAASTLKQICCAVTSEGGKQIAAAYPFTTLTTGFAVPDGEANREVVIAIRPKLLFNGIENRSTLLLTNFAAVGVGDGVAIVQLVYNPTLTGGTWEDVDATYSVTETNKTVTGFTGGIVLDTVFVSAGGQNKVPGSPLTKGITNRLPFGLNIDGTEAVTLALIVYRETQAVDLNVSINWDELR